MSLFKHYISLIVPSLCSGSDSEMLIDRTIAAETTF